MEGVGATGSVAGKLRVAVMNWTWLCSSPIDKQDGKRRERAETMEHHISWVIVHLRVSTLMQNLDFLVSFFFLIDVKHANVYTLFKKKLHDKTNRLAMKHFLYKLIFYLISLVLRLMISWMLIINNICLVLIVTLRIFLFTRQYHH